MLGSSPLASAESAMVASLPVTLVPLIYAAIISLSETVRLEMAAFVEAGKSVVVAAFLVLRFATFRRRELVAKLSRLNAFGRIAFRLRCAAAGNCCVLFSFLKRCETITRIDVGSRRCGAVDRRCATRGCGRCRRSSSAAIEIIRIEFLFAAARDQKRKNRNAQNPYFPGVSHQMCPPEARHFGLLSLQFLVAAGSFPLSGELHQRAACAHAAVSIAGGGGGCVGATVGGGGAVGATVGAVGVVGWVVALGAPGVFLPPGSLLPGSFGVAG
jgi:hypothetical protein